ncbi:hypothetical protein ACTJJ4_03040 [Microbacterium sp. 22195]|uniref:hypothetical protein n=1 Tax=Microbacterium sp. 22195 TaxID=3453891 RepID=UPI003F858250
MAWFYDLFFGPGGGVVSSSAAGVQEPPIRPTSPWAGESNVAALVYRDIYGSNVDAADRAAAMKVSPIKRGRAIIVGSCADLPLTLGKFDGTDWIPAKRQPNWFANTGTVQTPWHRMATTLDDLIFNGWSLWAVRRGAKTEGAAHAPILDAVRVAPHRWAFDDASPTGVSVDNVHVIDPDSVILFNGPDEGVLATGADTIRAWLALSRTRLAKARNPIPMTVLQETEENRVTQAEAEAYIAAWSDKRSQENGMVGFLPKKLSMTTHGDTKPEMFDTAFNALRLDAGNLLNLPASLLDGSTATASLTYVTTEGQRTSLIDWLEYWLAPIEARLSMPDVTPLGSVVRFDRRNLISVPNDAHGPAVDPDPEAVQE